MVLDHLKSTYLRICLILMYICIIIFYFVNETSFFCVTAKYHICCFKSINHFTFCSQATTKLANKKFKGTEQWGTWLFLWNEWSFLTEYLVPKVFWNSCNEINYLPVDRLIHNKHRDQLRDIRSRLERTQFVKRNLIC